MSLLHPIGRDSPTRFGNTNEPGAAFPELAVVGLLFPGRFAPLLSGGRAAERPLAARGAHGGQGGCRPGLDPHTTRIGLSLLGAWAVNRPGAEKQSWGLEFFRGMQQLISRRALTDPLVLARDLGNRYKP